MLAGSCPKLLKFLPNRKPVAGWPRWMGPTGPETWHLLDSPCRNLYIRSVTSTLPAPRTCCLDLDTFFVSVERLFDPSLVGQPVVVGALPGQRGVVTAASYEVRAFGVHSGMPITEAVRLAPHAIFVPTRHDAYGGYSRRVRAVIDRCCPEVQAASIDEFFLDFAGCESLYRRPGDRDGDATVERTVRELREAIQREVSLPASAGIGTTRAIAKMASGKAKPAGVLMVPAGGERAFVEPLPVRKLPGIGPVAEARLVEAGIRTLGELLALPPGLLQRRFAGLCELARAAITPAPGRAGLARDRPAFREHDVPGSAEGSISNERTFSSDVGRAREVEDELRALTERVTWRARRRGVLARTVTLKLRYADFHTLSRSRTVRPTHEERKVFGVARELLHEAWDEPQRIRLLGVALSNLEAASPQLELPFGAQQRPETSRAIDAVRARFGYDAIRLGVPGDGRGWVE